MQRPRGLLIAFEGIDGTGKTTQLRELASYLRAQGCQVVTTREPTDGPYGKKIRELYVDRGCYSPEEELELFLNDRREHVREVIEPALAAGKIVLTDRYYFSTVAYQGAAGCEPGEIFARNRFAPEPNMVLLLTMAAELSLRRIRELRGEELNAFEQEAALRKVAQLFASFSQPYIRRIDAAAGIEQVRRAVRAATDKLLQEVRYKCGPQTSHES